MATDVRERRTNLVVAVLALGGFGVTAVLGVSWASDRLGPYEPDCDSYEFSRDKWRDDRSDGREHEAEALAECDALVGMTRAEVTRLLGPHDPKGKRLDKRSQSDYSAGLVNDGFGPGDGQILYVEFARDGVVTRARLAYPQ